MRCKFLCRAAAAAAATATVRVSSRRYEWASVRVSEPRLAWSLQGALLYHVDDKYNMYIHTYIHTSIYPYMLEASERSDCCRLDLVLVRGLVEQ